MTLKVAAECGLFFSMFDEKAYQKEYRRKHAEKIKAYKAEYRQKFPEKVKQGIKAWKLANKDRLTAYERKYRRGRRKLNKKFPYEQTIETKLRTRLRNRIYDALKGNRKLGSAVLDLGCSVQELRLHLESKFKDGMSWDNYGLYGWHVDHIIPLSKFNLENAEEFKKAVHYTNLQPLWASDNLKKSNK